MNELTAIDILIDPDDSMKERAKSFNQRMLQASLRRPGSPSTSTTSPT